MINLNDERESIQSFGTFLFDEITKLPKDIRPDDKERSGIQIVVREPYTRNLVMVSVYNPSEDAKFFAIEQAVRSTIHNHASSQNSEDPDHMQFAGSVTVEINEQTLQVSVSGLTGEEDTAVAVIMLKKIFNRSIERIIEGIEGDGGKLPNVFYQKDHYLHEILKKYL